MLEKVFQRMIFSKNVGHSDLGNILCMYKYNCQFLSEILNLGHIDENRK